MRPLPPRPISSVEPSHDTYLQVRGVAKGFRSADGSRTEVLSNINLTVARGEFVAIVGYSGSGKTTLINLLAGLTRADAGTIHFAGKLVAEPDSHRSVVFQNYSLLPWLSVRQNIALAADQNFPQWTSDERRAHVEEHIAMVNLRHAAERVPQQLSGGMRQRVALARGLSTNPRLLLLDEPLGALDALTRGTLQREIARILEGDRKTVVLITNDVDEALLLADRVIPLTTAPAATLDAPFAVPLERPRDRKALNRDPVFKDLRARILKRLLTIGEARCGRHDDANALPPLLRPADLSNGRPFFHWHARRATEAAAACA